MATRAAFTFIDDRAQHHVYKHFDSYPEGAARALTKAAEAAWDLPRYEAGEFGAAFVAANKERAGGVRLTSWWRDHVDLEYRYEVFQEQDVLQVRALKVSCSYPENLWTSEEIFCGSLRAFIREHAPEAIQGVPAAGQETLPPARVNGQRERTHAGAKTGHLFEALPEAA